jgi:hypothetical protein
MLPADGRLGRMEKIILLPGTNPVSEPNSSAAHKDTFWIF